MKLIDELQLKVCSGKGGDGIVSWLRLKHMPKGGPAGGDGGKGGDVYVRAVKDIEALRHYASVKELKAQDGKPGKSRSKKGEDGKDLYINLPIGSVIKSDESVIELLEEGKTVKILNGGRGGYGNARFKSSSNRAPKECRPGQSGRCLNLHIELQLIADVGIVGKPSAGKTSLLNSLSNTGAKVGNYPFTTVEPNLGKFFNYTIADIPGLIEGAHLGKGLGIKFLKHIKRTKLLLHLVSAEEESPEKAYSLIRDELKSFDKNLSEKREILVLSKSDLISNDLSLKKEKELEYISGRPVFILSLNDPNKLEAFKKYLKSELDKELSVK